MNQNDMNILIEIIKNISASECKAIMKQCNVGHNVYATITEIDGNNYSVLLTGGTQIYTGIKNKSNSNLAVGDAVIIEAINGNIGNGFIIAKMGE
nr:MAG TPA: translation initiation factor [Caudoviricetes sp.]